MGLDMYLHAEKYLGRWNHTPEEERAEADAVLTASGLQAFQVENAGVTVQATVMYWRKANAIHNWFVQNVQGGVDDCGRHYVDVEKLEELRDTAQTVLNSIELVPGEVQNGYTVQSGGASGQMTRTPILEAGVVIADPTTAQELLPPVAGFFFGGTGFDQYYVEDLESTVAGLNRVLELDAAKSGGTYVDYYYHSSW